jgi:hypothetical protein
MVCNIQTQYSFGLCPSCKSKTLRFEVGCTSFCRQEAPNLLDSLDRAILSHWVPMKHKEELTVLVICWITWRFAASAQLVVVVFRCSHRVLWFCMVCLWSVEFVFIALIMALTFYICSEFQALFFESRGRDFIFLQHFQFKTHGPVMFSGNYLQLWVVLWCPVSENRLI